ncbi:MAG: hypothetical protein QOI47_2449 [Actinomycetota bacterium]|nr:hypothetical protein [Actinomycetota bacterium]
MQCVAQSAPYITMSVGGLRALKWQAKAKRRRLGDLGRDTAPTTQPATST